MAIILISIFSLSIFGFLTSVRQGSGYKTDSISITYPLEALQPFIVNNGGIDISKTGKILEAALGVLEYEKLSFENLFIDSEKPVAFNYLLEAENVLLTPHIAGWTYESHEKLAQTIVNKIKAIY